MRRLQAEIGDVSVGTLTLFLTIGTRPGLSQREYGDILKLGKTTVSQQALRLTEVDAYHRPGPGLIDMDVDPAERRRKILTLTTKGQKLLARVVRSMEGYRS